MLPDSLFNLIGLAAIVSNIVVVVVAIATWIGAYAFDLAERRMV